MEVVIEVGFALTICGLDGVEAGLRVHHSRDEGGSRLREGWFHFESRDLVLQNTFDSVEVGAGLRSGGMVIVRR